jgi:hypothetical protein
MKPPRRAAALPLGFFAGPRATQCRARFEQGGLGLAAPPRLGAPAPAPRRRPPDCAAAGPRPHRSTQVAGRLDGLLRAQRVCDADHAGGRPRLWRLQASCTRAPSRRLQRAPASQLLLALSHLPCPAALAPSPALTPPCPAAAPAPRSSVVALIDAVGSFGLFAKVRGARQGAELRAAVPSGLPRGWPRRGRHPWQLPPLPAAAPSDGAKSVRARPPSLPLPRPLLLSATTADTSGEALLPAMARAAMCAHRPCRMHGNAAAHVHRAAGDPSARRRLGS